MSAIKRALKTRAVKKSEHLLFNLLDFDFFRRSREGEAMLFFGNSRLLNALIAVPYIVLCELVFFKQRRFFVMLGEQRVGILVVKRKPSALFISSLAVAPEYRRQGIASRILGYCERLAKMTGGTLLELTVLKGNLSARRFYAKSGFELAEEKRRSFLLKKRLH